MAKLTVFGVVFGGVGAMAVEVGDACLDDVDVVVGADAAVGVFGLDELHRLSEKPTEDQFSRTLDSPPTQRRYTLDQLALVDR